MNTFSFAVLVIIYYILHSILADDSVKDKLYKIIPSYLYRIIYSIISIGGIIYLSSVYNGLPSEMLFVFYDVVYLIGALVAGLGLGFILSSFLSFDMLEFVGIKQLFRKNPELQDSLNINGLYRWVRHPIYTGTIMVAIGLYLFYPEKNLLVVSIITIVYTILGASLEERRLISQFGEDYVDYQSKVPFLFPIKLK